MKKLTLILVLAAGALAARAEDTTTVAKTPAIDHMVYLSFLPEPEDLMADAKAGGLTILRLDKTADRLVVTYKYPDGHTATLGYALLGSARNTDRVKERPVEVVERTTTVIEREPEVVYVERPYYPSTRVVYRDRWDDFWPPLVLGLGIGYISGHHGHHHHYYRGHGHHRWRH
ncbi:MAG: hypothetical protein ACOZE5_00505 [Verrucomicrobiota bacterium]